MQENGPREAVETVRKKLKHGGTQQKLRVLEVKATSKLNLNSICSSKTNNEMLPDPQVAYGKLESTVSQ